MSRTQRSSGVLLEECSSVYNLPFSPDPLINDANDSRMAFYQDTKQQYKEGAPPPHPPPGPLSLHSLTLLCRDGWGASFLLSSGDDEVK